MSKFTAIYLDTWMSGEQRFTAPRFCRTEKLDDESVLDMLKRFGIAEETVYLFNGWPTLQGESGSEVKAST